VKSYAAVTVLTDAITVILAFLFVLGILICVHELGHFLMARWIGVRVLAFSVGFGPRLFTFHRNGTEYRLSALPLGGYVKLAGEKASNAPPAPGEFMSKSKWQRCQVILMGPLMNVAFAFMVMAAVLYQPAQRPVFEQQPVVIGRVSADSVGAKAGLQPGDHLVTIDDSPVKTWRDYGLAIASKAKRKVRLGVLRDGRQRELIVEPEARGEYAIGYLGIEPTVHPQVVSIEEGEPASIAGLQVGDVVLAADGADGISSDGLLAAIGAHAGQRLSLSIQRAGTRHEITLVPDGRDGEGTVGAEFSFCETYLENPGATEAIRMSAATNLEWGGQIFSTFRGLFTGDTSLAQLMGPVAIADLSGQAAQAGWIPLFTLIALLSLNLGVVNLLPIPVLDGGHIAMLGFEGLARRDVSPTVKNRILRAGAVALLCLMAVVLFNDVMRLAWIGQLVQLAS
jgi:regulator of sigma E protease